MPKTEFICILLFIALLAIEIESGKWPIDGEDESGHRKKGKISGRRNKEEDMKKAKEIVDGLKKMKKAEGYIIDGGDSSSSLNSAGSPMFANLHYDEGGPPLFANLHYDGSMSSNVAKIHVDDIHRAAMFNSFLKHNQNHQPHQLPPFHQYPPTNPYPPHSNPSIPFAPPFMPPIHQQIPNFQQQQIQQIGPNLHNAELHGQQIDNLPQFLANLDGMRATKKNQNERELGKKEKNMVLEVGVVEENINQGPKGKGKIVAMAKGKGKQPAVYEGQEDNENESEELSPNKQQENHDEHHKYCKKCKEKNIIKMKIKVNTSQCPKINDLYRRKNLGHNKELPIGLAKLRKSATAGSSLDEWKWSEFNERTWTNGMVAAFSLPTVWAEEMMTVDEFLNGKAHSGQKENEFIEGNIFRLKIFKNPDLKWNNLPDIISEPFSFDNTEEIIQFNVECNEEMQQNGEFKEVIKGNITKTTLLEMNAHLLTGQPLVELPYKQLMPASMAMQKEIHPNELLMMPPPSKGGYHQEWPKMGEGSSSGVGKTPEEIMEEDFERNKGSINEALWKNDGPFGGGEMGGHHHQN